MRANNDPVSLLFGQVLRSLERAQSDAERNRDVSSSVP